MPRVSHFELPADNPSRCMHFYQTVFSWRFEKWEGPMEYWMIKTGDGNGIDGGLGPRQHPGQTPTNVVDVPNLDATTRAILGAGGRETVPKMAVPGVGWLAYFTDTEGNAFGVMQFDAEAS